MTEVLQQLVNGVSLGSTYALLALGLAIVFTIFGLVNFAHGELITIAAYSMLLCSNLGLPWFLQALVGIAAAAVGAVLMELVAFRPVRHASGTTMLITSFGVSIVIQAIFAVTVSARVQTDPQPAWASTSLKLFGLTLPVYQVFTIVITVVALLALVALLRRTTFGLAMRGAAEDFQAARLLGVRAHRLTTAAFAISGLLAGVAAVLILARTGGSVYPTMGLAAVLKAFVAIVIGGMGSLSGAVVGGMVLGIAEVSLRAYLPGQMTGLTDGILFVVVVLVIFLRPQGLLGKKARLRT